MKIFKGHQTSLNIAKRPTFFKTVGYTAVLMLLMVSIVGSLVPDEVFAVSNQNLTSWGAGNEVEKAYYSDSPYTAGVWVSAPGSSYGSTGVDVREGQTSVDVVIRGSWSPRKRVNNGNSMNFQGVYAKLKTSGTYPLSGGGTRTGSGGLSLANPDNDMFYRGDKPGNPSAAYFTRNTDASDGQVAAKLNVSGRCNGNYGKTVIMSVYIASIFTVKPNGGGAPVSYGGYNYDKTDVKLRCIATSWRVTGTTTVNRSTATVGQTVTWTHRARNVGPADMNKNAQVNIDREFRDSSGNRIGSRQISIITTNARGDAGETFFTRNRSYVTQSSDVGNSVCERLAWQPEASDDGSWDQSPWRCTLIPIQYEVYPNLQINSTAVQPGTQLSADVNLYNQGNSTTEIDWEISRVVIKRQHLNSFEDNFDRNMAVTPNWRYGQGGSSDACSWLNVSPSTGYSCALTSEDGTADADRNKITQAAVANLTVPTSVDYGDIICFVLGISGGSNGSSIHRYAQSNCMLISKSPKIQVWGGDLRAGSSIRTSQTSVNGKTFGSWGEYAVMSTFNNALMASAGSFQGGAGAGTAIDRLTFANRTAAGVSLSGGFGNVPHMDLRNQFMGDNVLGMTVRATYSNTSISVTGLASGVYEASGTLRIRGDLNKNQTVVIRPARNPDNSLRSLRIVVEANLRNMAGVMTNVNQMPQLVIVADNVDIDEDVTVVNAWLLASGNINTCANGESRLTTDMCDRLLTINGPVETNTVSLRRTGGSGTTDDGARSDPAEVFNLRADASIWLYSESADSGTPITVNVRELPPRF